ncbi:MAG: 2-C-methyl-D-erythritol 2,4-cyclodiphosphate synthase [Bacteroidetes bacterium]|nr:2-C-methyl-D-erythritol 2,4-cyclodiphosphate synthase [Bacteroidota bacterium]
MRIRVGQGVDVHKLAEGHDLWLGGILIPHVKGAVGHSDADVLIHAICDALLGAAGMKDIGFHFPDTSDEFKGIDSKVLLRRVVELISAEGWKVNNVDATLILEKPRIKPFVDEMKKVLAGILQVDESAVSVKATTNESLGYVGREEGLLAFASALIIGD